MKELHNEVKAALHAHELLTGEEASCVEHLEGKLICLWSRVPVKKLRKIPKYFGLIKISYKASPGSPQDVEETYLRMVIDTTDIKHTVTTRLVCIYSPMLNKQNYIIFENVK